MKSIVSGGSIGRATLFFAAILTAAVLLAAVGIRTASAGSDDVQAVREMLAAIAAADKSGEVETVLNLYTDDAILLSPNGTTVSGKEAIREHYAKIFAQSRLEFTAESTETQACGDWAFDRGVTKGFVIPVGEGQRQEIDNNYLMILRRTESGWKIARLMWSLTPSRN